LLRGAAKVRSEVGHGSAVEAHRLFLDRPDIIWAALFIYVQKRNDAT